MRWNEFGKFLIVALAIIGGFCVYISPLANSIKQGLDLQGGTHVVLQAVDTPELKVDDDAVNRSVKVIERRVNELGLTEPVIQRQGKDRIIVELPGVKDPEKAIAMLGRTAMLQFKDESGKVVLTGSDLKDAKAQVSQGNQAVVGLEFNDEGGKKFADLTARNVGKKIAIELDGQVLLLPAAMHRFPAPVTLRKPSIWQFCCAAAVCRLKSKLWKTVPLVLPSVRIPRTRALKPSASVLSAYLYLCCCSTVWQV